MRPQPPAKLRCCFRVTETDDPELLEQWMAQWSDLVEFEVHEVITSDEAAARVLPRAVERGHTR